MVDDVIRPRYPADNVFGDVAVELMRRAAMGAVCLLVTVMEISEGIYIP